eukprot:1078829-Amorphochlora_amoeboformis.AAC.1
MYVSTTIENIHNAPLRPGNIAFLHEQENPLNFVNRPHHSPTRFLITPQDQGCEISQLHLRRLQQFPPNFTTPWEGQPYARAGTTLLRHGGLLVVMFLILGRRTGKKCADMLSWTTCELHLMCLLSLLYPFLFSSRRGCRIRVNIVSPLQIDVYSNDSRHSREFDVNHLEMGTCRSPYLDLCIAVVSS